MNQKKSTQHEQGSFPLHTNAFALEKENTSCRPVVVTSVLRQFMLCAKTLLEMGTHSPTIGIVTGAAGIGKTMAACAFHVALARETSPSQCLAMAATHYLTPSQLVSQVLHLRGISARGDTQRLITLLHEHPFPLLLIDNADALVKETWELLSQLSDEVPCSILLIGHSTMYRRLDHFPYLIDRVSIALDLRPVTFDEVLHLVLPQWIFHPEEETDQRLAQDLWSHVTPSLRQLRNVLNVAATIAHARHKPTITHADLYEALQWTTPLQRSYQTTTQERSKVRMQEEGLSQKSVHESQSRRKDPLHLQVVSPWPPDSEQV